MSPTDGPAPVAPLPLAPELMARWGIDYDAPRGILSLTPLVPVSAATETSPAFRAGRTVVRLTLRRRPSSIALGVAVSFGPPLRVEARLPGLEANAQIQVDDVAVDGPVVAFEARGEHVVHWLLA